MRKHRLDRLIEFSGRDIIVAMRGGVPPRCNFCFQERVAHELHPDDAGEWACDECVSMWEEADPGSQREARTVWQEIRYQFNRIRHGWRK